MVCNVQVQAQMASLQIGVSANLTGWLPGQPCFRSIELERLSTSTADISDVGQRQPLGQFTQQQ